MPADPTCPELTPGVFRTIIDVSPHPVLIHDGHAIAYVNQATCRVFKAVSAAQLIGSTLRSIVHPDSFEATVERVKMILQDGHTLAELPLKLTALDNEPFHVVITAMRIYDQGCPYILVTPTMVDGESVVP